MQQKHPAWFKSFYAQVQECKKTGNRFTIKLPEFIINGIPLSCSICIYFKDFCHSKACYAIRKKEGIDG